MEILQKQYTLLQASREEVFNFLETQVGKDLHTPVPGYDNRTIRYLLEHTAGCYFNWMAHFALKQPVQVFDDHDFATVNLIRRVYGRVDDIMVVFLENFKDDIEVPIQGLHSNNDKVNATPLQLFTHVLTHEFHHKGQIMSMCRLLGYTPPDTDVSLFFNW